jgi:subtilisin family serine protease
MAIAAADHWCPAEGQEATFGHRMRAENLLEVPFVRGEGLTGQGVNVVIVDQGLNAARLGADVEGWAVGNINPGATNLEAGKPHGGHGMLVAANIRSVAPNVRLFDLPMLPKTKIEDVPKFFNTANEAFGRMLDGIAAFRRNGQHPGPWILVNAWAIFDTKSDREGRENYSRNPAHPFNRLIDRAVGEGHDVVFGAGNCGAFCADSRCGAYDRGPGRSILGASSNPKVITVGAVRSDTMWLGYSSQGPGQAEFGEGAKYKPDFCAPSNFVETDDAGTSNGGTSTACALTAGVVAALRTRWSARVVSPSALRDTLNATVTPIGDGWNERTGRGILNARAAFRRLSNAKAA